MTRLNLIRALTACYAFFIVVVVASASLGGNKAAFIWGQGVANDKVWHFLLVGTLAFLLNLSIPAPTAGRASAWLQTGSLAMFVVATIEELSQLFFTTRTFDFFDLGCNYLGILVIGSAAWWFRHR